MFRCDGSANEEIVRAVSGPHGRVLDVAGGKLYWSDLNTGRIQRADLDGVERLVTTGRSGAVTLALDLPIGKMYRTNLSDGRIRRADLSGSNVEILASGLPFPLGIAIHLPGGPIPAVSEWGLVVFALILMVGAKLYFGRRETKAPG